MDILVKDGLTFCVLNDHLTGQDVKEEVRESAFLENFLALDVRLGSARQNELSELEC